MESLVDEFNRLMRESWLHGWDKGLGEASRDQKEHLRQGQEAFAKKLAELESQTTQVR